MFGPKGDEFRGTPVYCGSVRAIEAAAEAYPGNDADGLTNALIAVHDPALGLDRSVCLRDVVDWLRDQAHRAHYEPAGHLRMAAAGIETQFGSKR